MKIAITGHTQGIGLALGQIYQDRGHEVLGFSRSTGYDITNSEHRQNIITEVKDCDIFINNAHDYENTFCGTFMLTELWESWQGQKKIIANISSSVTMRWEQGENCTMTYRVAKRALEDCCEFLWNKSQWPQVSLIAPCLTSTPKTQTKKHKNKVDPLLFADLVYNALDQKAFRVQVLKLAVQPV
jgi:nucleoside-diphosphate-sugar epimerase